MRLLKFLVKSELVIQCYNIFNQHWGKLLLQNRLMNGFMTRVQKVHQ